METLGHTHTAKITNLRTVTGATLLIIGGVLFLDRYLKTGWLSMMILPAVGLFLYIWGVRQKHVGLILTGALLGGLGAGGMAAWGPSVRLGGPETIALATSTHALLVQIGLLAAFIAIGWGVIVLTTAMVAPPALLWALVPGGVFGGLAYSLLLTPQRWGDFVLCLALGVGLPLLLWGLLTRLIGLIIPGCLLAGIGPGLYFAWQVPGTGHGLASTGIMLIWFSLGWLMITMCIRWIAHKYVWWPLIPGGILAMVGMGLYIGGDPQHALGFISNTGSIALMIFGLYLLLMRKGIHH